MFEFEKESLQAYDFHVEIRMSSNQPDSESGKPVVFFNHFYPHTILATDYDQAVIKAYSFVPEIVQTARDTYKTYIEAAPPTNPQETKLEDSIARITVIYRYSGLNMA